MKKQKYSITEGFSTKDTSKIERLKEILLPDEDIICTECENIISEEEIGYNLIYWHNDKPYCFKCEHEVNVQSDKEKFMYMRVNWEKERKLSNDDVDWLVKKFATILFGFKSALNVLEGATNDYENLQRKYEELKTDYWRLSRKYE